MLSMSQLMICTTLVKFYSNCICSLFDFNEENAQVTRNCV